MSSDLAKMQHHQDYAEKSAYTALRDIHKALDGVRSEALDAVSLARYGKPCSSCSSLYAWLLDLHLLHCLAGSLDMSVHHCCEPLFQAMAGSRKPRAHMLIGACICSTNFAEHTANVQRFQATEQCHVKEQLHSLQQDVAKLKTSNDRLYTQCKGKADREHMQNVGNRESPW